MRNVDECNRFPPSKAGGERAEYVFYLPSCQMHKFNSALKLFKKSYLPKPGQTYLSFPDKSADSPSNRQMRARAHTQDDLAARSK